MFKKRGVSGRLPKIAHALNAANSAMRAGEFRAANTWARKATELLIKTKVPRNLLTELAVNYEVMRGEATKRGEGGLAESCAKLRDLLQARFHGGSYY